MRNATCRKGAKRLISLLLALLGLGASAGLAASPGSVPLGAMLYDNAEQLQGIAVVNGSLYMLTEDNLLRWRPGDAAPTALTADQPFDIDLEQALSATLLEDGGSLWRFEPGTGRLQLLAPEGNSYRAGKPVRLNWRMFTDDGNRPARTLLHNGTLWMIQETENSGTRLLCCPLKEGGKPVRLKVRDLHALAPGRDGRLLALQHDMAGSEKRLDQGKEALPIILGAYDTERDLFSPIAQVDLGRYPAPYSAALLDTGDAVYIAAGDRVWHIADDGTQQPCAMLPDINFIGHADAALWPAGDNSLYIAGCDHVLIRSRDPASPAQAAQLRINQPFLWDRRATVQVALAMGDTALIYGADAAERTQEELATSFLLNEVHSDVLVMDDHAFDLPRLGQKGYLLDLAQSKVLTEYVAGLDPKLTSLLWQDGRLVMIPYRVSLQTPAVHADALTALGLSVPDNFFALCDLVERFANENMLRRAPQELIGTGNYKEALVHLGVDLYFQAAHAAGDDISFDNPLFRRMMEKVQHLDTGALDTQRPGSGEYEGSEYPLMSLYNTLDTSWMRQEGEYARAFDFFTLAADEGMAPAVQASFTMLAVNSRTPLPEQAIRFLEEASRTVDPRTRVLLTPGAQGPILNPDYAHEAAATRRQIALYEHTAATAGDQRTRAIYGQEAQEQRRRLDNAETELKYLESADTVARARAIADHLLPQTGLMHSQQLVALADLVRQYAQGAISLDQFIIQADNKLRLVTMEYE